ncbi:alanine racemase [Stutzerimonas tarimensis]|uniref:Alanine racemase n=1 Tax=Stutzerimonas tarimensis TaxID=1507735 RepID=A0ABV7T2S0_9GAMM
MRPLVATVDLTALRNNYLLAKRFAPGCRAFAVVKANAYGHGVREAVVTLRDVSDGFAVASLEEGAEVRAMHGEARILLLEGCFEPSEYQAAAQLQLDVAVQGEAQAQALLSASLTRPLNVWLKLDSGMHRLGLGHSEARNWQGRLRGAPQVAELNLMSHFACADEQGHPLTQQQLARFNALPATEFNNRSMANSAAILSLPQAHLDWIRPGIMLYGATPFADRSAASLGLEPVMSLTAQIIAIREVQVGDCVGYGGTWLARRPSLIGTVSCGYADGYPRHAGPGAEVVIRGQPVPLAGRVSMDMLAVDLTDLPEARLGDEVELWGRQMPVDQLAHSCGTIGYELLTKVTGRVPRRYR